MDDSELRSLQHGQHLISYLILALVASADGTILLTRYWYLLIHATGLAGCSMVPVKDRTAVLLPVYHWLRDVLDTAIADVLLQ